MAIASLPVVSLEIYLSGVESPLIVQHEDPEPEDVGSLRRIDVGNIATGMEIPVNASGNLRWGLDSTTLFTGTITAAKPIRLEVRYLEKRIQSELTLCCSGRKPGDESRTEQVENSAASCSQCFPQEIATSTSLALLLRSCPIHQRPSRGPILYYVSLYRCAYLFSKRCAASSIDLTWSEFAWSSSHPPISTRILSWKCK